MSGLRRTQNVGHLLSTFRDRDEDRGLERKTPRQREETPIADDAPPLSSPDKSEDGMQDRLRPPSQDKPPSKQGSSPGSLTNGDTKYEKSRPVKKRKASPDDFRHVDDILWRQNQPTAIRKFSRKHPGEKRPDGTQGRRDDAVRVANKEAKKEKKKKKETPPSSPRGNIEFPAAYTAAFPTTGDSSPHKSVVLPRPKNRKSETQKGKKEKKCRWCIW